MTGVLPVRRQRPRAAFADRRREVERQLAAWGFPAAGRPGRLPAADVGEAGTGERLRAALQPLGPVFVSCGLYLATRADVMPASDCLALSGLVDRDAAQPVAAVLASIARGTGRDPGTLFAAFDENPCEARALWQVHSARLVSGEAVTVRVIRPDIERWLETDLELLDLLRGALAGEDGEIADGGLADVLADFRRELPGRLDLTREAEALDQLGADAAEVPQVAAPRVIRELAAPEVLVCAESPGLSLADAVRHGLPPGDLARRLALVWLRQALLGRTFPMAPRGSDLRIGSDGRIAFSAGPFAILPAAAQTRLWEYLGAAVTRDPAEAGPHLIPEMAPGARAVDPDQLLLRLRQVVPFRDGGWSSGSETLAEHLFVQWRVARAAGWKPRPHLLAFWRGFAAVAAEVRSLAPERDILREGVEELRLTVDVGRLGALLSPAGLAQGLEPYAALLVQVPQKLDEMLTLLASGEARLKLQIDEGADPRRRQSPLVVAVTLAAALGAIALLTRQLASPALFGAWGERIGAVILLVFGALLLRALGRMQ